MHLKISKWLLESVNRILADSTTTNRKRTKGQTTIQITQNLKIK